MQHYRKPLLHIMKGLYVSTLKGWDKGQHMLPLPFHMFFFLFFLPFIPLYNLIAIALTSKPGKF